MSSIAHYLAASVCLFLTSCTAPGPPAINTPVPRSVVPAAAAKNIHRYVATHRGWSRSVYHIERYPNELGYALFAVVHRREESARPFVGRGKSFALYCDPDSYKVIKEMSFQ
jgi:hypothetical protein